jgi:hypothetical protein
MDFERFVTGAITYSRTAPGESRNPRAGTTVLAPVLIECRRVSSGADHPGEIQMKFAILTAVALMFTAAPAFARQCPQDMAKIDAALKTAKLSPAQKSQVQQYRKEGEALHKAGKHPESEATLAKAKSILKVQ